MPNSTLLAVLARALMNGDPSPDQAVLRAYSTLGRKWYWVPGLVGRYAGTFANRPRPRQRQVVQFILNDKGFRDALNKYPAYIKVKQWVAAEQAMHPVPAARQWDLPPIATSGELASWLGVTTDELAWFADLKGLLTHGKLRHELHHYHYRILAKPFGSVRLIEAPKPRLKAIQRRILGSILEHIPPHPAVHGFRKGHSIKTFAAPHSNKRVVLKMDLHDFFPSIGGPRIQALFRTAGYPEPVADLLGGLCTNVAPKSIWAPMPDVDASAISDARMLYARPHLPQGAPTSPGLANICAYRADCRLAGLAEAAGATYTRYADDLAFSGEESFEHSVERFSLHAAAILEEEGFHVHHRKTRIMRQAVRQRLAGIVANQHPNIIRADFDRLKATLTNCIRHGPQSQNREAHPSFRAHLEGRIGFVQMINPAKGERLQALFKQIQWDGAGT
jgi:hypothetical protein